MLCCVVLCGVFLTHLFRVVFSSLLLLLLFSHLPE
jgi:hypothetical protein